MNRLQLLHLLRCIKPQLFISKLFLYHYRITLHLLDRSCIQMKVLCYKFHLHQYLRIQRISLLFFTFVVGLWDMLGTFEFKTCVKLNKRLLNKEVISAEYVTNSPLTSNLSLGIYQLKTSVFHCQFKKKTSDV